MKAKNLITIFLLAVALSSCSTTYYQLYKTDGTTNVNIHEDKFTYEDQNCKITYDLWGIGGNAGFKFYNKTDENIYLNIDDCFFILNGIANDYFGNRIVTSGSNNTIGKSKKTVWTLGQDIMQPFSISSMTSTGTMSMNSQSVSYTENKIITIPSKSAKVIAEFSINNLPIRNCDLLRYPTKKQIKPLSFSSANSPVVFSNRISYKIGNGNAIKIENGFYISEITNYPSKEFFEKRKDENCAGKTKLVNSFKLISPTSFYVTYQKINDVEKY